MYNLFRKSIILTAGLCLLFLSGCVTGPKSEPVLKETLTIMNLFSEDRETILYLNIKENIELISKIKTNLPLMVNIEPMLNKSNDIFISYNKDLTSSFEGVIRGEFSKNQIEFGLFWSPSWKKVKFDGIKYWINKDGFKIFILDNNTIVAGNLEIDTLINRLKNNILDSPTDSMYIYMPKVDDALIKEFSKGFIKGGINSLTASFNPEGSNYKIVSNLELSTDGKARSFSKLINIFISLFLKLSDKPEIVNLADNISIKNVENVVIVENIEFSDIFIADFINNLIFMKGEADK